MTKQIRKFFSHIPRQVYIIFFVSIFFRVALLVALIVYGGQAELLWGDSVHYQTVAHNLLTGEGYTYKGVTDAYRAPGYPLFFLVIEAIHAPLWLASLFQIFCASLIPVLVYYLARRFLSLKKNWAFMAAFLCSVEPVQVYYSVVLLPDAFFALALFGVTLFFLQWLHDPYWRPMMWAGVLLGLANYIRPAGIYLAVAIVAFFFGYLLKKKFAYKKIWNIGLFVFMMCLVMLPWYVHNYIKFGEIGFVSASEFNLYVYAAASTESIATGVSYDDARAVLMQKLITEAPDTSNRWSLKNTEYLMSHSKEIIFTYPFAYFKSALLGLNTFLFSGNYHYLLFKYGLISMPESVSFSLLVASQGVTAGIEKAISLLSTAYFFLAIVGKILWVVLLLGSILGLWFCRHQRLAFITFIYLLYFSVTIASVTIGVEARHRYMLNPLIFLFFTAMISHIYDRFVRCRSRI